MKTRLVGLLVGTLLGGCLAFVGTKSALAGSYVLCWTRTDAANYENSVRYEGYSYGGGWWVNNNAEDTPTTTCNTGDVYTYHPECEGPDCSGLTTKSWGLPPNGSASPYGWAYDEANDRWNTNEHGLYSSSDYYHGASGKATIICGTDTGTKCGTGSYSATQPMDAFASAASAHVALIMQEGTGGSDWVMESSSLSYGRHNWVQKLYRNADGWDGITRVFWGCP